MRWDIFGQVIDNFGDVGVCWRLARSLVARGEHVRLWLDDPSALQWMAPLGPRQALPEGLTVQPWSRAERLPAGPDEAPGDVVIEAFGCNLPEAFVSRMAQAAAAGQPPAWINLEYLSAEGYVERSHRLQSPVMQGPGAGLRKHFFYPGFTPRTGGLLQPLQPVAQSRADVLALRRRLISERVVDPYELWITDRFMPWVLLFCYDNAPVGDVLEALAGQANAAGWPRVNVWLTPGPAQRLARTWWRQQEVRARDHLLKPLQLHDLQPLPQHQFDLLLQVTDLNLVRGEDSAVQALWSGRPHLWQLYVQDDGVHADKSAAFLQRWMRGLHDWPAPLREQVTAWWQHWNGLGRDGQPLARPEDRTPVADLPPFPAWWQNPPVAPTPWHGAQMASSVALSAQDDLVTQLMAFVKASG